MPSIRSLLFMNATLKKKFQERLIAGLVINFILILITPRLAVWSSDEREFRLAFTVSTIGAIGVVTVFRVIKTAKGGSVPWDFFC